MDALKRAWRIAPVRWATIITGVTVGTLLLLPGLHIGDYSADRFLPHATCYLRDAGLIWLNVISDSFIALAYLSISATLGYLVYRARHDIPFHWMFGAFGLFIVTCGFTHVMSVITVWRPVYWLAGDIKAITAVASVATAVVLPFTVPKVFAMIHEAKLSDQRKRDLEVAHERLKESDELKSQLFANVSHELRTPISLILGPIQRQLSSEQLDSQGRAELEVAERNAGMLLQQVNNLLDLAKLEAGGMQAFYEQADLAHVVRLVSSYFDVVARERDITYEVDIPSALPAEVDADQVQRIVLNLLSNAFKFTPEGGTVRCTLEQRDERAVISVEDSGPGIPEHLRTAVLERFRQVDGSANRKVGGTGLGLSITHEFTRLHGGDLEIGTAAVGGAHVEVSLPLRAPEGAAVAESRWEPDEHAGAGAVDALRVTSPTPVPADPPVTPSRADLPLVLVVEDHPDMNKMTADTLRERFDVVTAFDGRQGLQQARRMRPDLIVTDIMMPDMSGDEMVRELARDPDLQEIPVIALTAKADDEQRVQMLEEGLVDHLSKPYMPAELLARVDGAISRRRESIRKLHELNRSLEQRVSERTEQIEYQADQLRLLAADLNTTEQRERRRLAHALHDHLQQLLVSAKLGVEQASGLSPAESVAQLEQVKRTLDESLQASRHVTLELYPPVLYDRGLAAALDWLGRHAQDQHGLEVDVTADPSADPDDSDLQAFLYSAVQELLLNVVKHAQTDQAVVRLERDSDNVAITVEDDGVGCSPDIIEARGRGEGFGLFNIRERLHILGGTLGVEAAPGEGCRIRMELPLEGAADDAGARSVDSPLEPGAKPSPAAKEEPSLAQGSGLRVMLVDDHRMLRDGLVGLLKNEPGIHVIGEAGDGREALELMPTLNPDVVVMDVSMPRMNGVEATRRLRAEYPHVRIVALSMHAEADLAAEMIAAGAETYVAKGGPASALIGAILGQKPSEF